MKQNEELLYQHLIHSAKNMIIKSISFPFKIRQTTIFRYETSHYSKKVAWHIWRRNPKRIFLFFHTKRFLFSRIYAIRLVQVSRRKFKIGILWEEMLTIDFFSSISSLSIPVYFCSVAMIIKLLMHSFRNIAILLKRL